MQKLCNKIIAIMLVAILLGCNSITTGVYATQLVEQTIVTSQENVTFNATIGNNESHDGYEYTANVDSTDTALYLDVNVNNAGYLKDIVINISNNNYKIDASKVDNEQIKNVSENSIELNQINTGKSANITLPIYLNKSEMVGQDELSRDSKVKLTATYVNQDNKEKKIEKEFTHRLNWTINEESLSANTNQKVVRYLNYNGKTMVSFLLSDVLNEYKLPVSAKEITLTVPTVKDARPSKVIVTAIDTANTNGKLDGTNFGKDNYNYDQDKGTLNINIQNNPNDQGQIAWHKDLEDKFIITYIYDINTNEDAITVNTEAISKITLINNMIANGKTEQTEFTLDKKIGDIATVEVYSDNQNINKGYMYSNKDKTENKLETEFTLNYRLHIGLAEALEKVRLAEVGDYFDEKNASNYIYNKKVTVSKEELIKILGEEGTINIINKEGTVLGTLNKDTLELEVNESNLVFETSKPQTEGEITLKIAKSIKGELEYSKEQIRNFQNLISKVQINQVSENSIKLEEPTSKATLEISNNNLSTVIKNENVIMNVTLERDDITDNLFSNPEVYIQLPEEVKGIDIKDAQLLYEDELISQSSTIEGNVIKIDLKGSQTEYSKQSISKGSVIRIVADLTLDNLSPSKTANIVLGYTNQNDASTARALNNETNTQTVGVNIVAPSGFVTTNTITGYNESESVTSQEGAEKVGRLPVLSSEKEVTISGIAVNNLGQDANGLKILGRIPFKGNKQVDGSKDLGSTFDTTLSSGVTVEGTETTIYYSENAEATTDLENSENGWSEEFKNTAKSYLIVASGVVSNTTTIKFNYKVKVPANINYANIAKATYGVYYNNDSEEGTKQNVILATPVGIKTDDVPEMNIVVKAKDMFTGAEIQDGGNIKEGQYLTYDFTVKNTSNEDAVNSKASIELPAGIERVIITGIESTEWMKEYGSIPTSPYEVDLGTIKSGETKTFSVNLVVTGNVIADEDSERVLRVSLKADNMPNEVAQIFKSNLEKGYVTGILKSTAEDQNTYNGQEIMYQLDIANANSTEKTNVIAKIKLPEGIEYISTVADETSGETTIKYEGSYDKNTREVTFNIGTISANYWESVLIKTKITDSASGTLKSRAIITCNETQDTFYTNEVSTYCETPSLDTKLTSNIDGNLLDTDTLEYYIDVTNTSNVPAKVKIEDTIPEELSNKSYKVDVNGTTTVNRNEYTALAISEIIELGAKQTVRITVVSKPHIIQNGQTKEVTNSPKVYLIEQNQANQMQEVSINSLTHTIEGTGDTSLGGANGTYKISGTAWLDTNKDGKKDNNETKLVNIKLTLYTNTGNIAKNSNGKEMIVTTDENGKYSFNNLNAGNYLVVAEYDNTKYIVTTYKANGISESENSDFFDARLGDLPVAATDNIIIENSNSYNIDLGLKEREQFDLRLDKTVSKVTVTNTKLDPKTYEFNKNFVQVSLYNTYVEYSTVLIEYTISITNDGKVSGYAKELVDYIPEGMAFSSDLNNNWYLGKDGNAYTTSLANTIINPGETKTVTLVLSRKMTGENVGLVHNVAEISKDYNENGLTDGNSTPGNKQDGENDMSYADVLLSMSTGREIASFIGITIGVLTIVALAVYLIKKYIISRI